MDIPQLDQKIQLQITKIEKHLKIHFVCTIKSLVKCIIAIDKSKINVNLSVQPKKRDMNPTHIEHIGIAVKNLDHSIPLYEKLLGVQCYTIEEVKDQRVRTAFFLIGETKIELLEATDPEGPIGKFLEKKGEGIHHIALAVENTNNALYEAESKGLVLIDKEARKGAEGMNIGFLHPKSTGSVLVEFCSK